MNSFENAHRVISNLAKDFLAHEPRYLSADYQEAEVRKDFIDKFWKALGWDVDHDTQKNPYEQEVKVERGQQQGGARKRADYAFFLAPNFRDVRFFVEAKKPSRDFGSPEQYFQTICYGWGTRSFSVLTSFEDFHILDCRYKPNINDTLSRVVELFSYTDYLDEEKFSCIYWLFSREAVASGSLEKFAAIRAKPKSRAFRRGLFKGGDLSLDEDFLEQLDDYRQKLALAFKKKNTELTGELLTEVTQRTLDRLVFTRFLEDKIIEPPQVENFGKQDGVWEDFITSSLRLDRKYNGIVFKQHPKLDAPGFQPDGQVFARICEELSDPTSPYNFNAIPIHILGSIYERFLGKVISDSARVVEKPEVRKAGGVYYTPEYIVRYIVDNTVGKLIKGKTPAEISEMRFADIACGSGSFLLSVFDLLLRYHTKFYNDNPSKAKKGDCVKRDDGLHLSLQKKQDILRNNIYGVDIDRQAVEVAQLSLFLKLLEDETISSTKEFQTEFHYTLLPSLEKNIVCGNSLIGPDILVGGKFSKEYEKKLNPMDFAQRFPKIMERGGFDAVIGNPPYLYSAGQSQKNYFQKRFQASEYQTDFYVYFIERGIGQLRPQGVFGMIVSDSWIKGKYFTKLRNLLFNQTSLQNVTIFEYPPFEDATIENSILFFCRDDPGSTFTVSVFRKPTELVELNTLKVDDCRQLGFIDVHHTEANAALIRKIESRASSLSNFCKLNRGVHTYRTDGYGKSKYSDGPQTQRDKTERSYHARKKLNETFFPEVKGKHLERYDYHWDGTFVSYGDWLAEPRSPEFFFNPKLAIRKIIAPQLVCTFIADDIVLDQSVYVAIKKNGSLPSLLFLLGILSSSIGGWYIQKKHSIYDTLYPWFTKEQLAHFPIVTLNFADGKDNTHHDKLVALVEQLLEAKKQLPLAQSDADKDF